MRAQCFRLLLLKLAWAVYLGNIGFPVSYKVMDRKNENTILNEHANGSFNSVYYLSILDKHGSQILAFIYVF